MTLKVTDRGSLGGVPGKGLDARIKAFTTDVKAAQILAGSRATVVSRNSIKSVRPTAPLRPGRYHGLRDAVKWGALRNSDGVQVAVSQLNSKFPPWLVHEIGTGQKAIQHVGGKPNPVGRPAKGATHVKAVKSQIGRRLSPGLVFASGNKYQGPDKGRFRQDQIVPRAGVTGAPPRFDRATSRSQPGIRISREIPAQHFIKKGGEAGFRDYRQSVLAAARSQLKKRRTG